MEQKRRALGVVNGIGRIVDVAACLASDHETAGAEVNFEKSACKERVKKQRSRSGKTIASFTQDSQTNESFPLWIDLDSVTLDIRGARRGRSGAISGFLPRPFLLRPERLRLVRLTYNALATPSFRVLVVWLYSA